MDHWLRETLISHSMTVGYEPQTNGMAELSLASWQEVAGRCCVRLELPECCGQSTAFINEVRNREKPTTNDIATEPLLLELRENDENAGGPREGARVEFWPPRRCRATALLPPVARDDNKTRAYGCLRWRWPNDREWNPNWCAAG